MKLSRILPLLLGMMLLVSASAFAAEKMEFVDSTGATGYYVDVNSIAYSHKQEPQPDGSLKDYELVQARVAVIKARSNRRYLYLMEFNREKMVYRILSSKMQAYDSKKILEQKEDMTPELPFVETSPMQAVVDYIYEQPRQN